MWVEFVVGSLLCSERFFSGYSVSVTNTKAYATLVTEHILFCLCIVIFLFSFIDVISVNTAVLIFVNSARTIKI